MADFRNLIERALQLKNIFDESALRRGEKPWSRGELVRGFVGDVGALSKLSMAADGLRSLPGHREKLGHELADCLWSVLVLADEYGVDLENEFDRLINKLSNELEAEKVG